MRRANAAQQQAFAAQYPTPMRATATAAYYAELVRTNRDLAAGGVTATALVTLEWGPILQQGSISDQAATFEIWRHGHFTFAAKPWPGRRSGRPIVRDVTAARNRAGDTREGDAE